MCGIAVLVSLSGSPEPLKSIGSMMNTIQHRGPNDEGIVFFHKHTYEWIPYGGNDTPNEVFDSHLTYLPKAKFNRTVPAKSIMVFGHRRLSIVDISPKGHQPMCYANERYWITFNGEIYNYQEIRQDLELLGHHFLSNTDTEVILAAYAQWGKECLHRFNGMWAFVIFDRQTGKIFASRDRFGVKPLYYWFSNKSFLAFASEIKEFTVLPGWKPTMNGARVYDYLANNLTDHTSETLFQDVYQIRGGEAFEICINEITDRLPIYRWYTLCPIKFKGTFEQASHDLRELLKDSVKLRLRADVQVGSCLSGGLDSSSIVCLANDILKDERKENFQKTFSACSDVDRFDEREFADEVISTRNLEAYYTYPSVDDLFETLDEIIWHQDEPFGSTSIYAQWLVFQLAANQGVKVMLDGQGADEQLCGYHDFFGFRYAELFRAGRWRALFTELDAAKELHGYTKASSLKSMKSSLLPKSWKKTMKKVFMQETLRLSWLDMDKLELNSRQYRLNIPLSNTINELSYVRMIYTSLPLLLRWEDRDSMAHSVESRVPFLDYRLVEFIMSLPEDFKICDGYTKRVLREGMRGILPEKIRMRVDKKGFITAEEDWIRVQKPDLFRKMLRESVNQSQGVLKEEAIEELERIIEGNKPFSSQIWRLICFGKWVKIFGVQI
ncbi:asparagine synthase (glutamine-hydrolyzing) [Methanosarcina sp.]|uniref:asparagine synthase (glutamine-hydrolyzing) n=1 Tax=Methanosarcina sp. TaxID=2213 RepID=UPI003BB5671F